MLDRRQELVLYYRECDSVANNIIGGSEQRKRKESMSVRCPAAPPKPRRCCPVPVPVQSFGGAGRCREAGRTDGAATGFKNGGFSLHPVQRDHQEGEIDRGA